MDTNRIRDTLARISAHAYEAKHSGELAYDMARKLERDLREPFPDEPAPRLEPSGDIPNGAMQFDGENLYLARATREGCTFSVARGMPKIRVEQFVTEAGSVRETVVVLHNGDPRGLGAIRLERLCILDHNSLELANYGPVTIRPGGMLVVREYEGRGSEQENMEAFWGAMAADAVWPRGHILEAFNQKLKDKLEHDLARPHMVGPFDLYWHHSGNAPGGQGVDPYRMDWRRYPAGFAHAALVMYRTAQRQFCCMTDDDGEFAYDPEEAYTTVIDTMPSAYDWALDLSFAPYEIDLAKWNSHDRNHSPRAYAEALFLAQHTGHLFTRWYLELLQNHATASDVLTSGDTKTSGWWSVQRWIEELVQEYGDNFGDAAQANRDAHDSNWTNSACGRGGAHAARHARACQRLGIGGRGTTLAADHWERLFEVGANEVGSSHTVWGSASTEAPPAWNENRVHQTRNVQFGYFMAMRSDSRELRAAADKCREYLGHEPLSVWNIDQDEQLGNKQTYYGFGMTGNLEYVGGSVEAMLDLSLAREVNSGTMPLSSDYSETWRNA